MVFKSKEFLELSRQHQPVEFDSPEILRNYHDPLLEGEINTIHQLVNSIEGRKRKEWIKLLCNENHGNFLGAWFEIMLYGWLKQRFEITVEPKFEGCKPDFQIKAGDQTILIEAKARLVSKEIQMKRTISMRLCDALRGLNKPYNYSIIERCGAGFEIEKCLIKVIDWLDSGADGEFAYRDEHNNSVELTVSLSLTGETKCFASIDGFYVNPALLRRPLCEKTNQHEPLHKSEYPYIIALYLEDKTYSAEEVSFAWYGKETLNLDGEIGGSTCIELDQSGIVYQVADLPFEFVSGFLVFHSQYSDELKSRTLSASYIANCFALHKVDPNIFPDLDKFVIGKKEDGFYKMKWVPGLY